jgi:glycosyltransferase EpsE
MKTSILLPVYNGSNYINKTILSILNQKGDWELIIQDDCSTDNTYEIVKNYLSEKVKYFKNSVSLKCFGTLNAAVANSSGELLRLFSHDDIMLENDIIICDKYLNDNKDIGLCFTNYDMIDENDNITSSS